MEPFSALVQVGYWLLATGVVLGSAELWLYVMLRHWRAAWYWPLLGALALGAGAFAGSYLGTPLNGVGEAEASAAAVAVPAAWSWTWGIGTTLVMFGLAGLFQWRIKGRWATPLLMLFPAMLVVALLVVYPFFFEFRLAFANLNLYTIGKWIQGGELGFVGFDNFVKVFTTSPLQTATFWQLLLRTLAWTGINLVFHAGFGLGLAMLLNRAIKGRAIYRMLLVIPWAVPQVVAVLAWRGEFHPQFGMVNQFLRALGLEGYGWWSDPLPIFISCCIVNIWLGIPFMMIVFLGGLQSIPHSYYEAASIDGASKLTQFFQITLPMLRPTVVPSITLGTIWTFNNINVIYLMTGQDGGNESADILVSALYKSAFTYSRYSFAAAFALVIFAILMVVTTLWMKMSRGTESATAR